MEAPLIKDDLSELRELNWPKLCFHKVIPGNTLTDVIRDRWSSFELCCSHVQIVKNLMALILNHITKWEESNFRISST